MFKFLKRTYIQFVKQYVLKILESDFNEFLLTKVVLIPKQKSVKKLVNQINENFVEN